MWLFIKKTCITVSLFILGIGLFSYVNLIAYRHFFDFSIKDKVIILGHSHPSNAYNDLLIENVTNLSQSGVPYFYTYYKLKELNSQNEISTVLLEFTNNQIKEENNQWIWGSNSMNAYLPRHLAFLKMEDIQLLRKNNNDFYPIFSRSIKTIFKNTITGKLHISNDYGGFESKLEVLKIDKIKKHSQSKEKNVEVSETNIKFLKKIVSYCHSQEIMLIFIRSPQHKDYRNTNEAQYQQIRHKIFNEIDFLDFNDFPLENTDFADYEHLNKFGAKKISLWFNSLLKKGLLSKENKSEFIHQELLKIK